MFTRNSIVLSNNIKTPLTAISRAIGNILQLTYGQLVKQLFSNQEQGFAYDPNDLTTLYQDAAGTIPVTAQGQPVGLMLDKSKGVSVLRKNLLTYTEDFLQTSWQKTSTSATTSPTDNGLVNSPDGTPTARSYTFPPHTLLRQICTVPRGVVGYQSLWVRKGATNPASAIRLTQNNTFAWNTGSSVKFSLTDEWQRISTSALVSGADIRYIIFGAVDAAGVNDVDCNGSIELWHPQYELTGLTDYQKVTTPYGGWTAGNHAYQTVSASRPILQQTPILGNELVANGDFSNGTTGWSSSAADLTVADGKLCVTSTGGGASARYSVPTAVGKTYTLSLGLIRGTTPNSNQLRAGSTSGGSDVLNINIGTVSATRTVQFVAVSAITYLSIGYGETAAGQTSYWDNVTVKEITGYRTDQNYLAFDGVDDFLQTNNIDFTATDEVSLFAGVRKLSDVDAGTLLEFSSAISNVGTFALQAPSAVNGRDYLARANGTPSSIGNARYIGADAPHSAVLTSLINLSEADKREVSLRVNNSAYSYNSTAINGGNFSSSILYIGRRAGSSYPFNGSIYGLIGVGRLTSETEVLTIEQILAKRTGVTLSV